MKKTSLLFISLLSSISLLAQKIDYSCSHKAGYHNLAKTSPFVNAAQVEQQKKYDVTFYKLDLSMTNTSTAMSGTVAIHSKAVVAIDTALLEFHNGFTITEIAVNGVPTTGYTQNGPLLAVPVNQNAGNDFVVSVTYNGNPPTQASNPLGGSGMSNDSSPNWNAQITWSLSEPFSAFEWFPCKQYLKDKADSVQLNITVPNNLKAGANGVLDSITTNGNLSTYHWFHRHPIAYYLISVAVGPYQEYSYYKSLGAGQDSVFVQNYIYNHPQYLANTESDILETGDMLVLFSDLFGLYPYRDEKYGHCLAPLSGGMEHQTMTTQGWFDPSLTAHELAHQWWGNYVTCGSWADIWINEGFASYSEYLMFNGLYSYNDAQQSMVQNHNSVMQQPGGSVWVQDSLNPNAIFNGRLVYQKGGAIIHTLRHIVDNDSNFFAMLRAFQAEYANATATGLEFKAFAEDFLSMDLTNFFNEWYFGEGYPSYHVQYTQTDNNLLVRVNQVVSRPTVTPFFTTPLELRVTRSGLADTFITVVPTGTTTMFELPVVGNFNTINGVDPKNDIINGNGPLSQNPSLSVESSSMVTPSVILFPNPTTSDLTVQFTGSPRALRIIDQKGRVVLEQTVSENETINLSNLQAGHYLVELQDASKEIITRSVIKR